MAGYVDCAAACEGDDDGLGLSWDVSDVDGSWGGYGRERELREEIGRIEAKGRNHEKCKVGKIAYVCCGS